jgi:hypothetical protein
MFPVVSGAGAAHLCVRPLRDAPWTPAEFPSTRSIGSRRRTRGNTLPWVRTTPTTGSSARTFLGKARPYWTLLADLAMSLHSLFVKGQIFKW